MTKITFEALKDEYQLAVMEHRGSFLVGDIEIATGYAKYLILYLEMQGAIPSSIIHLVNKEPMEAMG